MSLVAGLFACLGLSAMAEQASYDLTIRGFRVGKIEMASSTGQGRYAVEGLITNTGLTRVVRQFSFKGQASGVTRGIGVTPERYQEVADTGKRRSEVVLRYTNGVPKVLSYGSPNPPGPDAPTPASMAGSVDPLTAIYALLRDIPSDWACKLDLIIYDGARQSRIFLRPTDREFQCRGQYIRERGFLPDEIARHRAFDFVLGYQALEESRLRVTRVSFDSIYGKAVIERR